MLVTESFDGVYYSIIFPKVLEHEKYFEYFKWPLIVEYTIDSEININSIQSFNMALSSATTVNIYNYDGRYICFGTLNEKMWVPSTDEVVDTEIREIVIKDGNTVIDTFKIKPLQYHIRDLGTNAIKEPYFEAKDIYGKIIEEGDWLFYNLK